MIEMLNKFKTAGDFQFLLGNFVDIIITAEKTSKNTSSFTFSFFCPNMKVARTGQ